MTRVVPARPEASRAGQHVTDVLVERTHEARVPGNGALHVGGRAEVRVVVDGMRVLVDVRMMRAACLVVQLRHRQVHLPVPVEPVRRRGEREVRRHERHEQHPGPVAPLRSLLVQPDLRARRDVAIVDRVRRLAGTGHLRHLLAALAHRDVVPHEPLHVADAFDDVHRHDLFGESAVVARFPRKCSLPIDTVRWPASRSTPCQLGIAPS